MSLERQTIERLGESKEKKTGHNTRVRFIFVRHAQKASGRIFDKGMGEVTKSGISELGAVRAGKWGKEQLTGRKIRKTYVTESDRTKETLGAALRGAGLDASQILPEPGQKYAKFFSLPYIVKSKKFTKQYDAIVQRGTKKYMDEHYPGTRSFDDLSTDAQEEIAEYAEEPALEWYLAFGDKRPDKHTASPREHAASVAFKINRLINLPDHMPNDKELDELISVGHKTSTEAFLKYCITREKDGQSITGFDSLKEIGGSIKILDSWELLVENNNEGKKHIKFVLKREKGELQEYDLDLWAIHELAKEHIKANKIRVADADFSLQV